LLDVLDDQAMAQVKGYRIVVVGAPTTGCARRLTPTMCARRHQPKRWQSPSWIG
jgi:hypothetical protein